MFLCMAAAATIMQIILLDFHTAIYWIQTWNMNLKLHESSTSRDKSINDDAVSRMPNTEQCYLMFVAFDAFDYNVFFYINADYPEYIW